MTQDEVRESLEKILEGEITGETIVMLLDAAIHASVISGVKPLEQLASEFLGMCIEHNILSVILMNKTTLINHAGTSMKNPEPVDWVDHDSRAKSILDAAFKLDNEQEEA